MIHFIMKNMKKGIKYLLSILVLSGILVSCKDDEEVAVTGFSIDREEITIGENGGTELVKISTDASWQSSTEASWLQLQPGNGVGSGVSEIKADSSVVDHLRETEVRFMAERGEMKILKVKQFGYAKEIVLDEDEITLENTAEYEKCYFEVTVTANVNFDVIIPEGVNWLTFDKDQKIDLDYGDRPRTGKLRFEWSINMDDKNERTAEITFMPENTAETESGAEQAQPVVLKVVQKKAPELTDDRAGDSLAVLAIYQELNGMFGWDTSENMRHWENVKLWEASDKIDGERIPAEMVGRVRSAAFQLFSTKETIPYQVKQLKYAEELIFFSNANREIKDIELGEEICELMNSENSYLKRLTIGAYGLVSLPEGFRSDKLEALDLSSNNFAKWPTNLNKQNFPNLKRLEMNSLRRQFTGYDLSKVDGDEIGFRWETGFGKDYPYNSANDANTFKMLLQWENLEVLSISVSLLEGELPSDEELLRMNIEPYTEEYIKEMPYFKGDTISLEDAKKYLLEDDEKTHKSAPRVWPKMKELSINLNFLTGELPKWILYHPYLEFWNPYSMIFTQESGAINSKGQKVQFDNEPQTLDYYYEMYPGREPKITE